jgi:hypothetical protein
LTLIEYLFDSEAMGVLAPAAGVGRLRTEAVPAVPMRYGDAVLSGDSMLPVLPALRALLPAGGLQRGSVLTTGCWGLLALALAAGASAGGAWCAAVGVPELGVLAATEAGLDPGRLLLVADPGQHWPQVAACMLDGCDIVILRPPDRPAAQLRRKLEAVARRHGSVLIVAGEWEGAQVRLLQVRQEWIGIGPGYGRLRARKVLVAADGRGAGARSRERWLWLPAADGSVHPAVEAQDDTTVEPMPVRAQRA